MSLTLVVALAAAVHAQVAPPTIPDLIAKLHAARQVDRYHLLIDAKTVQGKARAHVLQIWKDGKRYRTERLDRFDGAASARRLDCVNCPNVGEFFAARYDAKPDLSKAAVIGPLGDRKRPAGAQELRFEDLGATNETLSSLELRGLAWHVDLEYWTERGVVWTQWKGLPAYKIVLRAPAHESKAVMEVTLVPERGFAPVEVRSTWTDGQAYTRVAESDVERVAGMWLPTTCTSVERADGQVVEGYVQRVRYFSVNKPLDPEAFTLDGMDLVPGTLIGMSGGAFRKWDGKQIAPAPEIKHLAPGANETQSDQRRSGSLRVLLYVLAGAAALAAMFSLRHLARSMRGVAAAAVGRAETVSRT